MGHLLRKLALSVSFTVLAGSTAFGQDYPSLLGVWVGEFRAKATNGYTTGIWVFEVYEQSGDLFGGRNAVTRDDDATTLLSSNGRLSRDISEEVLGVIDDDGVTFHIADVGDEGIHIGRIIDQDSLEITYIESGSAPIVVRAELDRLEQ